jgi:WD40 repeat protein
MVVVYTSGVLPSFVALLFAAFSLTGEVLYQDGRQDVARTTKCAPDLPASHLSLTTRPCSSRSQQNKAPTQLDNGASVSQEAIHGSFVAAGLYAGGKRLMLARRNQILELWDLQTGRRLDELIGYDNDDIYLTCAAITPDGTRAFLGGQKRVVVWDIVHRRVIEGWGENWGDISSMAMSADGKTLLLGQAGGYAELRSVSTGERTRVIYQSKNMDAAPDSLAFSANGRYALVGEWGDVTLCEVATGRKLGRFAREPGFGRSSTIVAFSPDSNSFATIGFGAWTANSGPITSLRLWNRRTGKLLWKLVPSAGETVSDIVFTPDSKHLVTGGDLIRVWDVATHREIRHFPEQKARSVYSRLLITPGGQEVISQHQDNQGYMAVELWKLATGERVPIRAKPSDPQRATMQQRQGGPGLEQRARQNQSTLNRQLIVALVAHDDTRALTLVMQGADPDTRYEPTTDPIPPTHSKREGHPTPPPVNDSPTAFMIACGAMWDNEDTTFYAQEHHPDTVQLLQAMLEHHANVNATAHRGETALWWAVRFNHPNMVGILLAKEADVNAKRGNGETPLMSSVKFRVSLEIVRLLLNHGAKVNAQNDAGWTALIYAVQEQPNNETGAIRELLSHGADPNMADRDGRTPLSIAQTMHRSDLIALLKQTGNTK